MEMWKLPGGIVRQVQDQRTLVVEKGAALEMHVCRVALREMREVWADKYHPGWRADRFNPPDVPF